MRISDWSSDVCSSDLRHLRDRALVLLGFWRGFRGDELVRLQVQDLRLVPGEGMTCFLPHSKGDRQHAGRTYKVPALSRWCPVAATSAWVDEAELHEGPLFRAVDQWAGIATTPDRKSGVEGKGVSGGLDRGGWRIIK